MRPNQIDKLLHSKGNQKKKKTKTQKDNLKMGESSFKWGNGQGLNLQNIKKTYTTQQPKRQKPNGKMGKRPE